MRISAFQLAVLALFLAVSAGAVAAQATRPINQTLPSGWNAPTSGPYTMGYMFYTTASNVTVVEMGCCQHDGNAKTMWLWDSTSTASPIATITTAASAAGAWRWGSLSTPVTLVANRNYVVSVDATTYYWIAQSSAPAAFKPTGTINWVDSRFNLSTAQYPNTNNGNYFGPTDIGYTQGAQLIVSATAGSTQTVYANHTGTGGNGFAAGQFSINNSSTSLTGTLTGITIQGGGSGNHTSAYTDFRLFRETGGTSGYDASDQLVATATFAGSPAQATFSVTGSEQTFTPSQTKTYYLVARLNGSATPGQTFTFVVQSLTVGSQTSASGVPSATMNGFSILAPSYTFADTSPGSQATAYVGSTGNLIQRFTINYPNGPNNTLTGITVQSSGSGHDQNDYSGVHLYRDANGNNTYDPGTDVQVATQTSFPSDNGSLTFTLSGSESQFTAGTTRTYFIIVDYNTNGTNNTTFATQLQSASGQSTGTTINGMPAPSGGATAGILLLANNLNATLNGPSTASSVNNNEQGTGGNGVVICDVTLNTIAAAWTVTALTFRASGSGNDQLAFNYIAVHEDQNGNGSYDGPTAGDPLAVASAGTAFATDNGDYVATLTNTALPAASSRRFFLVVKFAGTAVTGQTFAARLQSITATPPSGGLVTGVPTANAATITINAAVLSVSNAPSAPASQMREGGVAFSHSLGLFRFAAINNSVTVNGLTLTTSGSGNWATDLAVPGVEIYLDNGNGVFDAALDTLVFSGAGVAGSMNCTFSTPVNVANGGNADVWIRLNVAATAGASVPETFVASIANTTDVSATGATVQFGSPAPATNTLGVVTFFVTTFAPAYDLQTGGAAITITGSGFMAPITLTIGGAVCPGTAVVGAGGTQITGLTVPPGSGTNKVIVLTNGALGPKTLTQRFDYAGGSTIGAGGKGKGGGGGGCEASDSSQHGALWLAALALLAVAAHTLRKRTA